MGGSFRGEMMENTAIAGKIGMLIVKHRTGHHNATSQHFYRDKKVEKKQILADKVDETTLLYSI